MERLSSFLSFLKIFQLVACRKGFGVWPSLQAEEQKRKEAERTYKDFKCDSLSESGKIEKLKVKELDFYLKEHGLTTIGWKLNK